MASKTTRNNISKKPKLILKCSKVTKKVKGSLRLLKECSFSVYQGEVLAILAPPNNGKTTFAKIICGLVPPSSGEITIRGNKAGRYTNQFVSYLPEVPFVRNEITVSDLMNMYSRFFKDFNFKKSFKLLKQFKISPKTKIENLSSTAVQIVETIMVSSRKTSLYIFDDTLIHTDPKYRADLINIISSCKKHGAVVIFSQVIEGIAPIADKAIMFKRGEIYTVTNKNVYGNNPEQLAALYKEVFKRHA